MRKVCQECGVEFEAKTSRARFCATSCRTRFNNRRKERGAELYDLFMPHRYDRAESEARGNWSMMCSRAAAYRQEDLNRRDGRVSWDLTVYDRLPLARAADAGDGR